MLPSMSAPARRVPTFDELYDRIRALPEGVTGEILEPGVLRTMSRPGTGHEWAHLGLYDALEPFDARRRAGGWWILREMEIRLPGDRLLVPDLAGWRAERLPEFPDVNPVVELPDWCCEVLSPSTAQVDRVVKLPLYAASGVAWVWLVDPELRAIEVFETVGGRAVRAAGARDQEASALPPFEGLLRLAGLWKPLTTRAAP
jgi:Uma2 family endonuclease